ncbi:SigE family RNA polymerase sigma factor [Streptomyces sp. NPDC089799]|uniref:SigE family RNA polymerase sigma factor n=1 Tax=Streptomyces sp. NPDC089799 TaxID=3155066 RepID=UPI003431E432
MQAEQEAQFQAFVAARWNHLVRTAYLLTGDPHDAEDVTQSALAKAYRSWRRVSRSDNPEAYVRRMLVNCNSDRFRKRRVTERLTATVPDTSVRDTAVQWADERNVLMAALAQLPARQRAVVVMRYWEDLSEAEVADVMGCSVGTVKSQASKALAKLRAHPGLGDRADAPARRTAAGGPVMRGPSTTLTMAANEGVVL